MEALEIRDVVDRVKDLMVKPQRLHRIGREDPGHLAAERSVPFARGAAGGRQQEAAPLNVLAEVCPLLVGQGEFALAGHDHQRKAEDFVRAELDRVKSPAGRDRRLFLGLDQEMVREALAALGAGIDQVGDLDDPVGLAAGLLGFLDDLAAPDFPAPGPSRVFSARRPRRTRD